jgi:hypothetical protein
MNGLRKCDTHNAVLFSHKKEWNYVIYRRMDGSGDHVR